MNLFRKAMLAVITMVLAVVAIVVPANRTTEVEAATTWSLAGDFQGWNASDKTYTLEYNNSTARYEIIVTFAAGAQFKIVKNYSWDFSIGWDNYGTNNGKGTYLQNSGGNFKVKTAGDYLIYFYDKTTSSYNPWAGDVGIEVYTVSKHTITYHAETTITEEYSDGQVWNSKFIEKEGYRLEGWYTDSKLTSKFTKGTKVTSDLDLYPNYVLAENYTVYFNDNGSYGASVNAYTWSDEYGDVNVAWPGVAMTKVGDVWAVEIVASKSCDKIIFNDGTNQTVNLDLVTGEATYVLGAEGNATVHETPKVTTKIAWQQGTLNDAAALRIVVVLEGLTTENVANFVKEISIKTTHAGIADTQVVDVLFTGVVDLATGDAITGDLYAVLTYTNIPTGEYAIEVLFDGAVVATETATIA